MSINRNWHRQRNWNEIVERILLKYCRKTDQERENIQQALDNNLHAVGIFFDLTKAYDVINHNILLHKLESYGVRGIINAWFKSYLSEHKQYVSLTQTNGNNNF